MVFVTEKLVARPLQALAAAKHHVFRTQRRSRQRCKQEQQYGAPRKTNRGTKSASRNTTHGAKSASQRQVAASRKANCSMANATPFSSFVPVSCQPYVFNSGTLFPMTTGIPANESISRSLWLSPMARISERAMPRNAAHSASDDPLEQPAGITSIIAKSLCS